MDIKDFSQWPESPQRILIHQVKEQSDMCDVTVKVDHWEKRFHRCVLIQSPFFECVFRHEYKETLTGKIEINLGTPTTIEMAIMFLYGERPKLTMENAEIMMALAEYFLIPNLKSACVAWLQAVDVNEKNCTKLIKIGSLFDINLYKCMAFAIGRLDILFENEEFTCIDYDSVKCIFTERSLSYISMDDRLKFLVKWTQADPVKRLGSAKDLVKLLDFRDNSRKMIEQIVNDPIFRDITEGKVTAEIAEDEDIRHEVLIMDRNNKGTSFLCLDLTRKKWFKLETSAFSTITLDSYLNFDILGVQNSESTVYLKKAMSYENKLVFINLETCLCTTFPVVQIDGFDTPFKRIDQVRMYADICIIEESAFVLIKKHIKENNTHELGRRRRIGLKRQFHFKECVTVKQIHIQTSTVHIGKVVNDRIETKPLFTFRNGNVSQMCIDKLSSVAFVPNQGKSVFIYNINDCKLEIIEEPKITGYGDEIRCAVNGFVIFNNIRCIYLLRQNELASDTKYQKKIFEFGLSVYTSSNAKLYFFNDRWYRYFQNLKEYKYQFEWASHDELLAAENQENVNWTPLPLPMEESLCSSETLNKKIFHICLQKSKLRCYIECPHCDHQNNPKLNSLCLYQSNIRRPYYSYMYDDFAYNNSDDNSSDNSDNW